MAPMPEKTKARLQKERAVAALAKTATKPVEKGNQNQTAMLLAEAAMRHARRSRNMSEIQACKDAIEFFQDNPHTCYITVEQREKLYDYVRMGLPARKAVLLADIDWGVFRTWRQFGGHREHFAPPGGRVRYTQAPEPFKSFVVGLYKAEAEAQEKALSRLMTMPDTNALKFFLERRFPDDWGQKNPEPVQIGQATQSTVNIVIPDNSRGDIVVSSQPPGSPAATGESTATISNGIQDEDDIDGPTMSLFMDDGDAVEGEFEVVETSEDVGEEELLQAQAVLAAMVAKAERIVAGEEVASPPKPRTTKRRST